MRRVEPPIAAPVDARDPFLAALGDRVRSLRARKGMTRRDLSLASAVSERHLASLEGGVGNASVLILRHIAQSLDCQIAELLGDETTVSPEWLLIRDLLRNRSDDDLRRGRLALAEAYGQAGTQSARSRRLALVGLRGAGKSSLGQRLADALNVPFVELNREIERVAGCGLAEIHNLLGSSAYRRYERRALEETIALYPDAVIATPGGIVSDASTFNMLLANCFTVWLKASPEEHMNRVIAQGDLRPMAGNSSTEAMDDLKRILAGRAAFYGKADRSFDTSKKTADECFDALLAVIRSNV
ncbi:MAG: helix-turn-helix transcriptional regulator [Rhizobacter sp.]|nr:helix-turn-helix transcriptional regulator [Burkholderiales bacterium]